MTELTLTRFFGMTRPVTNGSHLGRWKLQDSIFLLHQLIFLSSAIVSFDILNCFSNWSMIFKAPGAIGALGLAAARTAVRLTALGQRWGPESVRGEIVRETPRSLASVLTTAPPVRVSWWWSLWCDVGGDEWSLITNTYINYLPGPKWITPTDKKYQEAWSDYGTWGDEKICDDGTYVKGVIVRTEENKGLWGDDSALNAIQLLCSNEKWIESAEGSEGSWVTEYASDGLTAVSIRIDGPPNVLEDNHGAAAVRFKASKIKMECFIWKILFQRIVRETILQSNLENNLMKTSDTWRATQCVQTIRSSQAYRPKRTHQVLIQSGWLMPNFTANMFPTTGTLKIVITFESLFLINWFIKIGF